MTYMRLRILAAVILAVLLCGAQDGHRANRWAQYEHEMQNPVDDPPGAYEETEFAFARLRFRSFRDGYFGRGHLRWGTDANKSERQFILALRRLTSIDVRSVEHIVDIDSDEIYDWPWLYAVGIGHWELSESQIARLRNYFNRGGFLMVDDFHGPHEWADFMAGVRRILPGHEVVELEDEAAIFHVFYNLEERFQVPGLQVIRGRMYERGGVVPHWRAVLDGEGRVQIVMCFNMDVGDAWEWADHPEYPERYAALAARMGVNYILYSMTH